MFKSFFSRSKNITRYENGLDVYALIDMEKTPKKYVMDAAKLLDKYQNLGGDLSFMNDSGVRIVMDKLERKDINYYFQDRTYINKKGKEKEASFHHELEHARQEKLIKSKFPDFSYGKLDFKSYVLLSVFMEADAYASEAAFAYKNRDKIKFEKNSIYKMYEKTFSETNDEKKSYEAAFKSFYDKENGRIKNYEWHLSDGYSVIATHLKDDGAFYKESDMTDMFKTAFKQDINQKMINDVVENFSIPMDCAEKLEKATAIRNDSSHKDFSVRYDKYTCFKPFKDTKSR